MKLPFGLKYPGKLAVLRIAAVAALIGLGFTTWVVVDPGPMSLVLGSTIAHSMGGLSFLIFVGVVIADLRRSKVLDEG